MPQVYKRKTEKCKRSPKEILFLDAKECDKGPSIQKAALLFNLKKTILYQYLKKTKKFDQNVHLGMILSLRLILFFFIRYGEGLGSTYRITCGPLP